MFDPFQALAWFAGVNVPEADTANLRARAVDLRAFATRIGTLAAETAEGVEAALKANDSNAVARYADVWPKELAPRYAALQEELEDLAVGCEEYADAVDEHREQLLIIGTQLAAMAFTLLFGYLYPFAARWATSWFKELVRWARLRQTAFQRFTLMILRRRVGKLRLGSYLIREGFDAVADSVVWAVVKTGVHMGSSWATGNPIGGPGDVAAYAGRHFLGELAYNGGIKGQRDFGRLFPKSPIAQTLLGGGPSGRFFRRVVSGATIYPLVASGSLSTQGALRSALAHAPRAFILHR
ncbi:hypothetical protein [Nonomuraea sp. NPDC002799]